MIEHAVTLARSPRSFVHVLSIARIWGSALGLQHPGLYPTKREWQEQRDSVAGAVRRMQRAGLEARGAVIATRNASKVIAREARRLGCRNIVVGWTPPPWWMAYLLQDDVWWLQRRANVPVIVVPYGLAEEPQ